MKDIKCRVWWALALVWVPTKMIVSEPYPYAVNLLMLVVRWIMPKLRAHANKSDADNKDIRAYMYVFPRHHLPGLVVVFSMLAVFLVLNFYQTVFWLILALVVGTAYSMTLHKVLYFVVQMVKSPEFRADVQENWRARTAIYFKPSFTAILGYGFLVVHVGLILSLYSNPDEILTIYPHLSTAAYLSGLGLLLMNVLVSLHMIGAGKSYKLGSHTSRREQVTAKKSRLKSPISVIRNSARFVKYQTIAYFKDVDADRRFMFINYFFLGLHYVFSLYVAPFLHNPESAAKSLLYPFIAMAALSVLTLVVLIVPAAIVRTIMHQGLRGDLWHDVKTGFNARTKKAKIGYLIWSSYAILLLVSFFTSPIVFWVSISLSPFVVLLSAILIFKGKPYRYWSNLKRQLSILRTSDQ